MTERKNPCDVCDRPCEVLCGLDCIFDVYAQKFECRNCDCFLNNEGMCAVSAYERCGAWEG